MPKPVTGVNPKILIWARERSGQTIAQVAKLLDRAPEEIQAWEASASAPTYAQLERLAYQVYKRPLAVFFFPEPPDEPDPQTSFRTLPSDEIQELTADTRFKIRQAHALQLALYELQEKNPAPHPIFREIAVNGHDAPTVANEVRKHLDVLLSTQRDVWKTPDDAFKGWREAVEERGVYVFKNSFRQKDASGFCLYDAEFPLIYVNNSTAKTRQIFTVFHELGHILFGTSGVTKRNDQYINALSGEEKRIEVFCNQFATEVLLPAAEFKKVGGTTDDSTVSQVAAMYKVSRQMVLLRMLNLGMVSQAYYDQKATEWNADYEAKQAAGEGGGNYYLTQGSYLGERFLRLAFGKLYEGKISVEQLAEFLNVRVSSVPGLEELLLQAPNRPGR